MSTRPQAGVIVHVFGRTDVGRTREHNEDAFVVADLTRGNASLHAGGADARGRATAARCSWWPTGWAARRQARSPARWRWRSCSASCRTRSPTASAPTEEQFAAAIKRATASANAHIHAFAVEHPEYRGMGTTATVAGLLGDTLYLAQVGDSRAYLVRDGVARQITKDQSLMQKLIEAGEMTEEEAEQSERRNIILQALGPEANDQGGPHPPAGAPRRHARAVQRRPERPGARRRDRARRDRASGTCPRRASALIDRANESGGPDNITVVVARFEGDGLDAPAETDDVGHRIFPLSTRLRTDAGDRRPHRHGDDERDAGARRGRTSCPRKRSC